MDESTTPTLSRGSSNVEQVSRKHQVVGSSPTPGSIQRDALESRSVRAFPTEDAFLPLDRRWAATVRIAGRTIGAYGATRDDAVDALRAKLGRQGQ